MWILQFPLPHSCFDYSQVSLLPYKFESQLIFSERFVVLSCVDFLGIVGFVAFYPPRWELR